MGIFAPTAWNLAGSCRNSLISWSSSMASDDAGDVGERRLRGFLALQLRARLAEVHDPAAAALHLGHEEPDEPGQQDERQQGAQQAPQHACLRDLDVVALGECAGVLLLLQLALQLDALALDVLRADQVVVLQRELDLLGLTTDDLRGLDVPGVDLRDDLRGVDALEPAAGVEHPGEHDRGEHEDEDPEQRASEQSLCVHDGSRRPRPPACRNTR